MATVNLHIASVSITFIIIILAASIVLAVSITEFGNSGIAQGQGTNVTSSLTPEQKAAIRDPNNPKLKFVNSTESKICAIPPTPANTPNTTATTTPSSARNTATTPSMGKQLSSLYDQGYAKGVADAKSVQITTPPTGTMRPEDVDCDSDIDPKASNQEYCSGYQHGFADTINNALTK